MGNWHQYKAKLMMVVISAWQKTVNSVGICRRRTMATQVILTRQEEIVIATQAALAVQTEQDNVPIL